MMGESPGRDKGAVGGLDFGSAERPPLTRPMSPSRKLTVYIVDDSRTQSDIARALLEKEGHVVLVSHSSEEALRDIPNRRPDCVVLDIMMPGLDGYELCRRLRGIRHLAATKLVVVSTKAYDSDRKRAFDLGANGYFVKPLHPAAFVPELERIVADLLVMTFWGVRGTLPVSRRDSVRYGGNTSCVSLAFPDGRLLVFDAGTGIKALGDALTAARRSRIDGRILISHPHWDHINALPFFTPFYAQGNHFEICGPAHGQSSMRDLISVQMDGVYFPVTAREFSASVTYRDLVVGRIELGDVTLDTMLLRHPGSCLGYRLQYGTRSICYVTDNELYPPEHELYSEEYRERLIDFTRGADVLITDCTYTDEEYRRRTGWGHSGVSQVADLAWRAGVGAVYLVHHDPDQTDAVIDAKLAQARALLQARGATTQAHAPVEYSEVELSG
jgi:phosphoribosyl 1,2-cyclic phosphodiesterase/ActR/RegA family two-component response regulator